MAGPPVDLSFKNLSDMTAAVLSKPQRGLRPIRTNSEMKYLSSSLRLCYNQIKDIAGLQSVVSHFLAKPTKLAWLDLSFNKIAKLDPVLCELRELRMLNLHGNNISKLSDVDQLGVLPYLHTITLHGNPIEQIKGYRRHVIAALPQVKKMDFNVVTKEERVLANIWRDCSKAGKEQPPVAHTKPFIKECTMK
ncbi:leucine-rich repeat-containing protein 51-like [Cheilinus undulatus]|uniref:leucine-rich repeat-containing protein 51-like n=1 Tax=Cheilinus undulatus TaxID=241271 RepID=UPI001BD497DC|nr:leucine-rich repeat-containing protein 51-like [Cheilinus undulatus]